MYIYKVHIHMTPCSFQYFKTAAGARDLKLGKLAVKQCVEYLLQINHTFRLKKSIFKNVSKQIGTIVVNWSTKIHNFIIFIKYFLRYNIHSTFQNLGLGNLSDKFGKFSRNIGLGMRRIFCKH